MSPVICLLLLTTYAQICQVISVHQVIPTKGEVWPRPVKQVKYDFLYLFDSDQFTYEIQGYTCTVLHQALNRTKTNINNIEVIAKKMQQYHGSFGTQRDTIKSNLQVLYIQLHSPCEDYPQADMDENYTVEIAEVSTLNSKSIWGIIRGLETFTQLFYLSDDYKALLMRGTLIEDFPQYSHRGLLLDTGRHFLSVDTILTTLDAMAMNKMNVLHWHIVDEQSFPYQSENFPELSAKGAYHPLLVYTKSNVQQIIEYARVRGIRVMPEFDVPGHVESWGKSHSDIMSRCSYSRPPLNPIRTETYVLIKGLYNEVQKIFPEKYFHFGGDEVNMDCWKNDPHISDYMQKHHITDPRQLDALFFERVLSSLNEGTTPVLWEEAFFDARRSLIPNTTIQVWGWNWDDKMKENNPDRQINSRLLIQVQGYDWKNKIPEILQYNLRVIFSSYWYLDYKVSDHNFDDFYAGDPRAMLAGSVSDDTLMNILGGEACMWGEMVDDYNIMARMWPRASAIAEVLWSYTEGKVPTDAYNRIEEQKCRMNRFGVGAEPPFGPGFCITKKNVASIPT